MGWEWIWWSKGGHAEWKLEIGWENGQRSGEMNMAQGLGIKGWVNGHCGEGISREWGAFAQSRVKQYS